jgi:RNA ligase
VSDWERFGAVRAERWNDLILFDYKASAQWDNRWNWFERTSRGGILNVCTGEVVARPFDKFFNWDENGIIPDSLPVEAADKLDGSLGILYRWQGDYRVATRGAFLSPQAQWATTRLKQHYDLGDLPENLTLLFEIIYPDNRVVVDYGTREDMALVGVRDRFTGEDYFYPQIVEVAARFGFSVPEAFTFASIEAILDAATHLAISREGWVLRYADGQRFKVKGEVYRLVHRITRQTSFNQVLEAAAAGTLMGLIEGIPDELLGQVHTWQTEIETVVAETHERIRMTLAAAPTDDRKTFALWVREHHPADGPYLFAALDNRDITPLIYKMAFKR